MFRPSLAKDGERHWGVIDSFVCPSSGTIFSCIISDSNAKAILWYEGSQLLIPGDVITHRKKLLLVNGQTAEIVLHNISGFNASLWKSIQKKTLCPGNRTTKPAVCINRSHCLFTQCPYGIANILT